ncbi:MAG: hypothetical protein V4618_03225 [Pseudomonadota bacterium]
MLDLLEQTVESVDGLVVAQPDGIGNPVDKNPDRSRAMLRDQRFGLVSSSQFRLHEASLTRAAAMAIA